MLKLIIEDDEGRKTVVPFVRDEITIGRQEGNTIRLTERNVSRRHARLMRNNGHVLIEDLGSYNGIRINGDRISGQVKVADGDLIQIGDYDLAVQAEAGHHTAPTMPFEGAQTTRKLNETQPAIAAVQAEGPQEAADEDVREIESSAEPISASKEVGKDTPPSLPKHQATALIRYDQIDTKRKRAVVAIASDEAPRLVVLNTEFAGRAFSCDRTEIRIGRTDDNDIALDHRSLSRTHCKVVKEDSGEWRVLDMQSANGLMVNGESYAQVTLRLGDVLELGHVKLKFVGPREHVELDNTSVFGNHATQEELTHVIPRTPMWATSIALFVIIAGGGGYWVWKNKSAKPSDPIAAAKPMNPVVRVDVPAEKAAALAKLSRANERAANLEWPAAKALAKEATVEGKVIPEATTFLTALEYETDNRASLEQAAVFLEEGSFEKAKIELEAASSTKLLRARYEELENQRVALLAVKPKVEPVKSPVKAAVTKAEVQVPKAAEKVDARAEALFKEAKDEQKAQNFKQAAKLLDKCVSIDPTYHPCYRQLASVYASISRLEQNAEALDKAVKNYELFLKYAPADDTYVPKVQAILENFKNSKTP